MNNLPIRLTLLTGPSIEPVSLAEAKAHARIDETIDNSYVESLIVAARQMAENYTRRAFITQTWKLFLDEFPDGSAIEIPKAPLQSVTHVKTYDDSDVATVFASSNYHVDVATRPGRLTLRANSSWPTVARVANGVEVQFVSGYGDAPSSLPHEIRQAVLMIVAHLYEHRGDANMEMPVTAGTLLSPHRDWLI